MTDCRGGSSDTESRPGEPESKTDVCYFGCLQRLDRKRVLLSCWNCNVVECCLVCAEDNDACARCAPAIHDATTNEAIRKTMECVRDDDYCFSHVDYKATAPNQWAAFTKGITVTTIAVRLSMHGHHMVDDKYVDQQIGNFNSISISKPSRKAAGVIDNMQEKLTEWAETYQFDKEDLMEHLTYEIYLCEPGGYWTGTYHIVVYTP